MNKKILVQNLYRNLHRVNELNFCLEKNLKNKYFDAFYFFIHERDESYYKWLIKKQFNFKGVYQFSIIEQDRITFQTIFSDINVYNTNDIWIIANSDIFFDDTISKIDFIDLEQHTLALTRWEFNGKDQSRYIGWDYSQDVWVLKSPIKIDMRNLDFHMGKPGCDNRLAYEFSRNYKVINPCKSIRCHHYHISNYRNYTPGDISDTVPEPYLTVKPIKLNEI